MARFEGTFSDNKRPVITTAPDCLVYLNGELSLPSGGNPSKRVDIQPYITSVSIQAGVEQSPGSANLSLNIPRHALADFYRGGQLIISNMMEVRIFMKGHFLVGGQPRYYPVFWGLITSLSHSRSGGQQSVEVVCQDILYWWTIQRINVNPSLTAKDKAAQSKLNIKGGGIFTSVNPFDVMYSLSRFAFGDATNANIFLQGNQVRTEPNKGQEEALMAYWTKQWGRIAFSLKMFGPRGDVIQGDLLSMVLSESNRAAAGLGKAGSSKADRAKKRKTYDQSDVNFAEITAFTEVASRIGAIEIWTSEFQSKKEIADTAKQAIGYEFFQDVTGELIFKPPFYNLDVRDNYPVSWIRPIDVINQNFSSNMPEVTSLEATGAIMVGLELAGDDLIKPKATYTDYRLVQKYGWRPGNFSSAFYGAGLNGQSPLNLFYHLVDELDKQNIRMNTGSVTIPIRPELRLGYPIFFEQQDAYYYVENISHQFSYAGQCTTTITLAARRTKFYAAFPYWEGKASNDIDIPSGKVSLNQPPPSQVADPSVYPNNIYNRPRDPITGEPVGDCNVILVSVESSKKEDSIKTFEEEEPEETKAQKVARDLVSFRTQFQVFGDKDYVYQIDPARDIPSVYEDRLKRKGPLTSLAVQGTKRTMPDGTVSTVPFAEFPVSDERGYEVIGAFEYGRNVRLTRSGMDFTRQGDHRSRSLLMLSPDMLDSQNTNPSVEDILSPLSQNRGQSDLDREALLDPNNYGRALNEIIPDGPEYYDYIADVRGIVPDLDTYSGSSRDPVSEGRRARNYTPTNPWGLPDSDLDLTFNPNVERWQTNGAIAEARRRAKELQNLKPPTEQSKHFKSLDLDKFPDSLILAFIHVESAGVSNARRVNKNGKLSQYHGLLQIGYSNALDVGAKNSDFGGQSPDDYDNAVNSIVHFIGYQTRYRGQHEYDPDRMIMTWSHGHSVASRVGRMIREGKTGTEIGAYLDSVGNMSKYLARMHEAFKTWGDPRDNSGNVEFVGPRIEYAHPEDSYMEVAPHSPPKVVAYDPSYGDAGQSLKDELDLSNLNFERALQDNRKGGVDALPNIQAVRDVSLIKHVNDFLKSIYNEAFAEEAAIEKELRGETRFKARHKNIASIPTALTETPEKRIIDSPLQREDVRRRLEAGETLEDMFGTKGRWTKVTDQIKKANSLMEDAKNQDFSNARWNPFQTNDDED